MSGLAHPYKGKVTRSWPQLPHELIRHIATFYLWNLGATAYVPHTWDARELWHPRMVYTSIRDAMELEKNLMALCPQWKAALESHPFWDQAISLIDPLDHLRALGFVNDAPPSPPTTRAGGTTHNNSSSQALPSTAPLPPRRIPPYKHYHNILHSSCLICRINSPGTPLGLLAAKRFAASPHLGYIGLCREHDRRRAAYCGLCLRDAPLYEPPHQGQGEQMMMMIACLENEDEDTWPGIDATCRACRAEWLWRRCASSARDRDAIGGVHMVSEDWETRQCVDGFLDLGEGGIADVLGLAREKWWLRRNTRLADMMNQALAAARFNNGESTRRRGAGRSVDGEEMEEDLDDEELEEEEEEEEDPDSDDPELLQLTEESGVRDLALGDWARTRILDGHWISPADIWYGHSVPGHPFQPVRAVHPCPWARERPGTYEGEAPAELDADAVHPSPALVRAEVPPSFSLCEQAFAAHGRQMRVVLLPPMRNIVRRVVMECAAAEDDDGGWEGGKRDPVRRIKNMGLEEVCRVLREEEGVWFDGMDWAERRRNEGDAEKQRRRRRGGDASSSSSSSSSSASSSPEDTPRLTPAQQPPATSSPISSASSSGSSTKSSASSGTSPVLSESTLQTTPSPPPLSDADKEYSTKTYGKGKASVYTGKGKTQQSYPPARPVTFPVAPVLDPPRLLRPIPFVPETIKHLPQFSIEAFTTVWREACAPLYHCKCGICQRAALAASRPLNNSNNNVPQPPPVVPSQPKKQPPPTIDPTLRNNPPAAKDSPVVEIKLTEIELDGEGEEEVEEIDLRPRRRAQAEEEEEEEEEEEAEARGYAYSQSPAPEPVRSRKRSSDELEEEEEEDADSVDSPLEQQQRRSGTPPKRARTGGRAAPPSAVLRHTVDSPSRLKKRNSEELEEEHGVPDGGGGGGKRVRVSPVAEPARRPGRGRTAAYPSRVSEADLEGLYVLGDDERG